MGFSFEDKITWAEFKEIYDYAIGIGTRESTEVRKILCDKLEPSKEQAWKKMHEMRQAILKQLNVSMPQEIEDVDAPIDVDEKTQHTLILLQDQYTKYTIEDDEWWEQREVEPPPRMRRALKRSSMLTGPEDIRELKRSLRQMFLGGGSG